MNLYLLIGIGIIYAIGSAGFIGSFIGVPKKGTPEWDEPATWILIFILWVAAMLIYIGMIRFTNLAPHS